VLRPELWRYSTRLAPWTLISTCILLGAAWAARTHLDATNERSVLAVLSSIALCAVFDDDAAAVTNTTPTPRWARRLPRAAVPVAALATAWALIVVMVAARRTGPAELTPWWAMTLEWSTVASSQLAVGAIAARRPGSFGSIAPGLLVALVWLTVEGVPMLHRHLHPVREHSMTWVGLLALTMVTIAAAWHEGPWHHRAGTSTSRAMHASPAADQRS